MTLQKNALEDIKKNINTVIFMQPDEYQGTSKELIKELTIEGKTLIINLYKTVEEIKKIIKELGGNMENAYYICVQSNNNKKEYPNSQFIAAPSDLTSLGIQLKKAIGKQQFEYLILDSVSTLLVYNDSVKTLKFLNYAMGKTREKKIKSAYIAMEEDFKKIQSSVALFADNIIKYQG